MIVCSKTVLFQFIGQKNSFFNHSNDIKVFSCTEPPCGKSDSQWGELKTRQRDYIFSSGVRKTAHTTFGSNAGWIVFVEIQLIMCLGGGKSYFHKTKQRLYQLLKTVKSYPLLFLTHWRGCCWIERGGIGSPNYEKRLTSLPRHRRTSGIRWGALKFRRALDCNQGEAQTEVSLQGGGDFTVHRWRHPVPRPAGWRCSRDLHERPAWVIPAKQSHFLFNLPCQHDEVLHVIPCEQL